MSSISLPLLMTFLNSIDKIYYDKKSDKYILVNLSEILIYRILLKNTDSIETYKYKSIDDNLIINRNKFLLILMMKLIII